MSSRCKQMALTVVAQTQFHINRWLPPQWPSSLLLLFTPATQKPFANFTLSPVSKPFLRTWRTSRLKELNSHSTIRYCKYSFMSHSIPKYLAFFLRRRFFLPYHLPYNSTCTVLAHFLGFLILTLGLREYTRLLVTSLSLSSHDVRSKMSSQTFSPVSPMAAPALTPARLVSALWRRTGSAASPGPSQEQPVTPLPWRRPGAVNGSWRASVSKRQDMSLNWRRPGTEAGPRQPSPAKRPELSLNWRQTADAAEEGSQQASPAKQPDSPLSWRRTDADDGSGQPSPSKQPGPRLPCSLPSSGKPVPLAGMIMWLSEKSHGDEAYNVDDGVYGHPIVVLSPTPDQQGGVDFLAVSKQTKHESTTNVLLTVSLVDVIGRQDFEAMPLD